METPDDSHFNLSVHGRIWTLRFTISKLEKAKHLYSNSSVHFLLFKRMWHFANRQLYNDWLDRFEWMEWMELIITRLEIRSIKEEIFSQKSSLEEKLFNVFLRLCIFFQDFSKTDSKRSNCWISISHLVKIILWYRKYSILINDSSRDELFFTASNVLLMLLTINGYVGVLWRDEQSWTVYIGWFWHCDWTFTKISVPYKDFKYEFDSSRV